MDVAPASPGALQSPGKVEFLKKTLPASYRAEKALSFSISQLNKEEEKKTKRKVEIFLSSIPSPASRKSGRLPPALCVRP